MFTDLEIIEIMQMLLDKKEKDEFAYGYGEAIKDLADLIGKNRDDYGVKE